MNICSFLDSPFTSFRVLLTTITKPNSIGLVSFSTSSKKIQRESNVSGITNVAGLSIKIKAKSHKHLKGAVNVIMIGRSKQKYSIESLLVANPIYLKPNIKFSENF